MVEDLIYPLLSGYGNSQRGVSSHIGDHVPTNYVRPWISLSSALLSSVSHLSNVRPKMLVQSCVGANRMTVYVGGPIARDGKLPSVADLAKLIGAIDTNDVAEQLWTYFAVPWPASFLAQLPPRPDYFEEIRWRRNADTDNANAIQVDLRQLEDPMLAEWAAFASSFGSLRPVLNTLLRTHSGGLSLQSRPDNQYDGLVLRIECLEEAIDQGWLAVKGGKKWCDVHLTADPSRILEFMGMLRRGEKWYDLKFKTQDDLAAWVCDSSFFNLRKLKDIQERYRDEAKRYRDADKYYQFYRYWAQEYTVNVMIDQLIALGEGAAQGPPPRADLQRYIVPKYLKYPILWTHLQIVKDRGPWGLRMSRSRIEVYLMHSGFQDRRADIKAKIVQGKAMYEPKRFWMLLNSQLRQLVQSEVVHELNIKRYGKVMSSVWTSWECLKSPLASLNSGFSQLFGIESKTQSVCLSAEDQNNLQGMVSRRVGLVKRRVEAKTVKDPFARVPCPRDEFGQPCLPHLGVQWIDKRTPVWVIDEDYVQDEARARAEAGQPEMPRQRELWLDGRFDQLLRECIKDREVLEKEQREVDVGKYLDSLERKGLLTRPRDQIGDGLAGVVVDSA